jgi:hypothetical protein
MLSGTTQVLSGGLKETTKILLSMKSRFTILLMMGVTCIILGHNPSENKVMYMKIDSVLDIRPVINYPIAPVHLLDSIKILKTQLEVETLERDEKFQVLKYQQKLLERLD